MVDFWGIQKSNKRKTALIVIVLISILCIVGYTVDYAYLGFGSGGIGFPIMTFIALIIGVGQSTWAYYFGDKAILASTNARPLNLNELREKQLHNIVEEISLASGIPMPFVYIIEEGGPNAFATGRDPMHASVAVTRELLNIMNREEIQGVIAHELAHIRNRDTLTLTVTVALGGTILILSDMVRRISYHGGRGGRGRDSGGNGIIVLIGFILIILAPIIVRLLSMAVSRSREYAADAGGVEFTRNSLGLANALQKIDDYYKGKLDLSKINQHAVEEQQKSKHLSNSPLDPLQMPIPVPPLGMPNKPIPPQNVGSKLTPEQNSQIDAMMQGYSEKDKYNKLSNLGHSLTADANTSRFDSHNADINTIFSDYSSTREAVAVDKDKYGVASLFIYNPLDGDLENSESWWANLWETHPPIQKRISILMGKAQLEKMMKR